MGLEANVNHSRGAAEEQAMIHGKGLSMLPAGAMSSLPRPEQLSTRGAYPRHDVHSTHILHLLGCAWRPLFPTCHSDRCRLPAWPLLRMQMLPQLGGVQPVGESISSP